MQQRKYKFHLAIKDLYSIDIGKNVILGYNDKRKNKE